MTPSAAVFAGVIRRQKKIVQQFQAAGATSADRAATAAALGVQEGMAFKQLRRHAILQDAGGQRLFLDTARWEAHQLRRWRVALTCITISVCIVVALLVILFAIR